MAAAKKPAEHKPAEHHAEVSHVADEPADTAGREPWADRLAKMGADEIQDLLNGPTLGERKRAEAQARLSNLRAG